MCIGVVQLDLCSPICPQCPSTDATTATTFLYRTPHGTLCAYDAGCESGDARRRIREVPCRNPVCIRTFHSRQYNLHPGKTTALSVFAGLAVMITARVCVCVCVLVTDTHTHTHTHTHMHILCAIISNMLSASITACSVADVC